MEAGEAQEAGAGQEEEEEAAAAAGDVVSHALQMTPRVSEEEPPPVARAQPQPEADAQDAGGAKGRRREAQAAEQPAPHSGRLERRRARG